MATQHPTIGINRLPHLMLLEPEITKLVIGFPGDGKTSSQKTIKKIHGDEFIYVYLDCPSVVVQDMGMTMPVPEEKTLEWWVNETIFKIKQAKANGQKLCIMLDEVLKASKMVKLLLTRLMLERTLGAETLPEGSVIYGTSNDPRMGIGDTMEQHLGNRLCLYYLRKVTVDEYLEYKGADIDPVLHGLLSTEASDCLVDTTKDSYKDNAMSINFNQPPRQSVTPRSLCAVNKVFKNRVKYGEDLQATIAGLCGVHFASLSEAFVNVADKVYSFDEVMADPKGIDLPENPTISIIQTSALAIRVETEEQWAKCWDYVERLDKTSKEIGNLFKLRMMKDKKQLFLSDGRAKAWVRDNRDLII